MHSVIASPQEAKYVIVRPGARAGMQIPSTHYREFADAVDAALAAPSWLVEAAQQAWGLNLASERSDRAVLVRPVTTLAFSRATWEINLGCNFNCEHCHLTGGEPLIDPHFSDAYRHAYGMGMLLEILTNGSRLHQHVELLVEMPPHKVTISLYGATADTFESLTRTGETGKGERKVFRWS
ncbi:molybdenum cofactor biosynthesis protein A [Streptomyces netropsis]|nr:molybdenum cofactor biosynthesis protein A [Streptomyces netropsis]